MADRSHTEPDATLPLEEQAFLERYDPAGFGHPSVAVDVVLLSAFDRALHALLLERDRLPERGKWALPGGFVSLLESLGDAAVRILEAKTGLEDVYLEQLYTFGGLDRDPRTRVISVAYLALMNRERFEAAALDNPSLAIARLDVPWQGETGGPLSVLDTRGREMQVAFDHLDILGMTVKRLRGKLGYVPISRSTKQCLARPSTKTRFVARCLRAGWWRRRVSTKRPHPIDPRSTTALRRQ